MNVSEAIYQFLLAKRAEMEAEPGTLMLDYWLHYQTNLETQVNVAAGDGRRVQGKGHSYEDDAGNSWWPIRIPKHADTSPEFKDYDLRWPLEIHADAIGSTGWNWAEKRSKYVGFDFDALTGHAKGRGVTDAKLEEIKRIAQDIPYVQVRRSTGGNGLHLYVFFEPDGVETEDHNEHAALARCVLGLMSADAGFNFAAELDVCGGNMWLWSRRATPENKGLTLVKAGNYFPLSKVPSNWKDHVDVITRKRTRTIARGVAPSEMDVFDEMTSANRIVPVSDTHKNHMDSIEAAGYVATWDSDRNMLTTHTCGFKHVFEEGNIKGVFKTISNGNDPQTPNCFAFPNDHESWRIYRFGAGIAEHGTWTQDGQGYTTCWFNRLPGVEAAAAAHDGSPSKKGGAWHFATLAQAAEAVKAINGRDIEIEANFASRPALLHKMKDGRVALEVPKGPGDQQPGSHWNDADKRTAWTQVFAAPPEPAQDGIVNYDTLVRCIKTPEHDAAGWRVKDKQGNWMDKKSASVKTVLQAAGNAKLDCEVIMGNCEVDCWTLVSLPFKPEYPGGREWNLKAPQLRYDPIPRGADCHHPTWDLVLNHLGREMDGDIQALDWARDCNIRTGGDYLMAWYAALIRNPLWRLPYLFFFGSQNCGKSTFWEAFQLLVTSGVVKADRSLTSRSDFNSELAGAVLCVVEERNVSDTPGATAKIKDAVTTLELSIHAKYRNPYQVPNLTHWCQCSNHQEDLAVPYGDTRIVVIYVNDLTIEIGKDELQKRLREEAPAFMRALIDVQLPPVAGRLALPLVETHHKARSVDSTLPLLDRFIMENCFHVTGEKIAYAEFYDKFIEWLPSEERYFWTRVKVTKGLPVNNPSGGCEGHKRYIGNLSWEDIQPAPGARRYITRERRLTREENP